MIQKQRFPVKAQARAVKFVSEVNQSHKLMFGLTVYAAIGFILLT
jgi:hypothetical protein